MLKLNLPPDLEKRLDAFVQKSKVSKQFVIHEAIFEQLEDEYWAREAEIAYKEYLADGKKAIPLEQIQAELGLENED